jgi:hypothetical protein
LDGAFHITDLNIACWADQQVGRRELFVDQATRKQEFDAGQNLEDMLEGSPITRGAVYLMQD